MQEKVLVSIRHFAREVGTSDTSVRKGIRSGRIVRDSTGKIDLATQREAWYANRDLSKARASGPRCVIASDPARIDPGSPMTEEEIEEAAAIDKARRDAFEKIIADSPFAAIISKLSAPDRQRILDLPFAIARAQSAALSKLIEKTAAFADSYALDLNAGFGDYFGPDWSDFIVPPMLDELRAAFAPTDRARQSAVRLRP